VHLTIVDDCWNLTVGTVSFHTILSGPGIRQSGSSPLRCHQELAMGLLIAGAPDSL
jgi:hypothetical protein